MPKLWGYSNTQNTDGSTPLLGLDIVYLCANLTTLSSTVPVIGLPLRVPVGGVA